ncbi:hypothetical protein HFN89_05290 [Rhizobium laguerreae]|nr:hypothetical protein [Rhizobium laguerreae]
MFIPRSIKQASAAAERLEIFCRDYLVPVSSQIAKDLIAKMFGHANWGMLKKAIESWPFSPFDEEVTDEELKQRRELQERCLIEHFGVHGLRPEDATTAVLLVKPSGRPDRISRMPDVPTHVDHRAVLRSAKNAFDRGDLVAVMNIVPQCLLSSDQEIAEKGFALMLKTSAKEPSALVNVGLAHILGHGTKKDPKKGVKVLQDLSSQPGLHPNLRGRALLMLAENAAGVHGTKRDMPLAVSRLLEATDFTQEGWVKLGQLYEEEGMHQEAADAYRMVATDHPLAAFRLASLMVFGFTQGDPRTIEVLLKIAARGGVDAASEILKRL